MKVEHLWSAAFSECLMEQRSVCLFDHPMFLRGRFFIYYDE
jgi:hypothetical protein